MKRAIVLLTVPLAFILAGHAPGAWACSCVGGLSQQEYADYADVIFVGVAIDSADPEGGGEVVSSGRAIIWTFDVEDVRKGTASDPADVESAADGASCGYSFAYGQRYRIYATRDGERLATNLCAGNEDLGATGRGREPVERGDDREPARGGAPKPSPIEPDKQPGAREEPQVEPDEPLRAEPGTTEPAPVDALPIAMPVGSEAHRSDRSGVTTIAIGALVLAGAGLAFRGRFSSR